MQNRRLIAASLIFAIAVIGAANLPLKSDNTGANESGPTLQPGLVQQERAKAIWIGDVLFNDDSLSCNGYLVKKQKKKVRYDYPAEMQSRPSWIDVSFAVLKHKGRILATFDNRIYSGMGNSIRFGLFSFLDGSTKELVVSQDIARGGTQWVLSLSPRPHLIFDGPRWAVGREGDDMRIIDLDHDGVFEITVPITDFYSFQDTLPISRIPLPEIVFKYDNRAMKYLPANPLFESYALKGVTNGEVEKTADEFDQRARALERLLPSIYVGKESQAWNTYNQSYVLSDKEEIRRRVKATLSRQPVYKFIYKTRRRK